MSETSSRLLELLSMLQARRDWPGGELSRRLEVSDRTIRRDVERLRRLGYPVESLTGPAGGYRLRAGSALPPLLLTLEQVLPAHLRRRVSALASATSTLSAPGPTVDPQHLTVIAAACRDSERLRFAYRSRDDTESRREVEPHSLVNLGRRWYLVAWDCRREDWRTFRVDRLTRPASTGVRFAARKLPAKDGAAYIEQQMTAAPNRYEARLTLHVPADAVNPRAAHWGSVESIDAHKCEYRTGDDDLGWLAMRVAMLGVEFEVHEPRELIEHLREMAARLRRAT
jgi:predicted DNA-binding transcriptional regulator YafY